MMSKKPFTFQMRMPLQSQYQVHKYFKKLEEKNNDYNR